MYNQVKIMIEILKSACLEIPSPRCIYLDFWSRGDEMDDLGGGEACMYCSLRSHSIEYWDFKGAKAPSRPPPPPLNKTLLPTLHIIESSVRGYLDSFAQFEIMQDSIDDTTMIRKFFVDRITALNNQVHIRCKK